MKPGNDLGRAGLLLSAGCVRHCVSHSMRRDRYVLTEELDRLRPEARSIIRLFALALVALYYGPALTLAMLAAMRHW
jgi:hypothetical protein